MFPLTDPILVFSILILTILAAPLLARRMRVPDIVLLLLAGVLLGPNGFGVLERSSAVVLFGSVGLLYIMFLAGLEIDLHNFSRSGKRSILFGLLTFLIPMILGSLAGRFVLGFSWPTSILLASMFASHTLLAYPIASRLGISRSEPVAVTVGATIITDILALLVLAVIADAARGVTLDAGFWLSIAAGLLALVIAAWQGIPRLARWFFHRVTEEGNSQYLFVLATVCVFSYFSHLAKMEPIIGAFLVGAALNRLIPERSVLMNRVIFAGNTLFIPFFLIAVGMLVDPGAMLHNPRSWVVAGVMIAAVIATKYAAAWISGKAFGYGLHERSVMFGMSVVQAAATLAAVLVGYDLKIFDETVLNGAIAMIAVTCPLGAWIVDRHGRKMTDSLEWRAKPAGIEQRILALIANPVIATRIMDFAFILRDVSRPGVIHPVTIVRDEGDTEAAVAKGEKLLAHCLAHAASADIPVEPSVHVDVNVSDAIIRSAKELRSTLVIAGWHESRTSRKRLFGSIMIRLIEACPSRLLICRFVRPMNTNKRLLVLFPPLWERRNDSAMLLRDIKHLSRQTGTDIRAYLTEKEISSIRGKIESTKPERPLSFVRADSLASARALLLDDISDDDLVILPGERRSSALWSPTHDQLAEMILTRFPENNVLIAYPDIPSNEDYYMLSDPADSGEHPLLLKPCDLDGETELNMALEKMVAAAFPDNKATAVQSLNLLLAAAGSYPVEMPAETLLLHAHSPNVGNPLLLVAKGRNCCAMKNLKSPPRIILALLSPASSSPEQHLGTLAELGRRFHDKSTLQKLRDAADAPEICSILEKK